MVADGTSGAWTVFPHMRRALNIPMLRLGVCMAGLGAAVVLLAGQVYATSPHREREALEIRPVELALPDRVRVKRPEPGVLVNATQWGSLWIGADKEPASPRGPIRVVSSALKLAEIAAREPAAASDEQHSWVEVSGSLVNIRSRPALSAPRVGRFERGKRLRVIERRGAWTQVEDAETNKMGWMHGDYLAKVPAPAATS